MPLYSKAIRANKIKRQKLSSLSQKTKLPKNLRDELRMTCVLRGYSALREEGQMAQTKQQDFIYDFFHGIDGKGPSQIKMVAEGLSSCKDLYETTMKPIVNKKGKKHPTNKDRLSNIKD